MTPSQKLPKNVRNLGKLIVAKGFKKLPKVQKIAQSGHTGYGIPTVYTKSSHNKVNKMWRKISKCADTRMQES